MGHLTPQDAAHWGSSKSERSPPSHVLGVRWRCDWMKCHKQFRPLCLWGQPRTDPQGPTLSLPRFWDQQPWSCRRDTVRIRTTLRLGVGRGREGGARAETEVTLRNSPFPSHVLASPCPPRRRKHPLGALGGWLPVLLAPRSRNADFFMFWAGNDPFKVKKTEAD